MVAIPIVLILMCWIGGFGYMFGFFQRRRPVVTMPTDTVLGRFTGGMRYGMLNATWPFAYLTVYPYHAQLRCLAWRFEFLYSDLQLAEEVRGMGISPGVRFITRSGQRVVFWTLRSQQVATVLQAAGAPILWNPNKPVIFFFP